MNNMHGIGLSFGNTSLCVASCKNKEFEIAINELGERTTPANLIYNQKDFRIDFEASTSFDTLNYIKYLFTLDTDLNHDKLLNLCEFENVRNELDIIFRNTSSISITKALNILLNEVYKIGYNSCMLKKLPLIITIPLNATKQFNNGLLGILKNIGFDVKQLIYEPIAALIFFQSLNNNKQMNDIKKKINNEDQILCYKIGGFSSNLCKINVNNDIYEIDYYKHYNNLGSQLLTDSIYTNLVTSIEKDLNVNLRNNNENNIKNKKSLKRIKKEAEQCKKLISKTARYQIVLESICNGLDWIKTISLGRFESIIQEDIAKILEPLKEFVSSDNTIKKIILYGGGFQLPILYKKIIEIYTDKEIIFNSKSNEIVALGCAMQLNYLMEFNSTSKNIYPTSEQLFLINSRIDIIDKNTNKIIGSIGKYSQNNNNFQFNYTKQKHEKISLEFFETCSNKKFLYEKKVDDESFKIDIIINFSKRKNHPNANIQVAVNGF